MEYYATTEPRASTDYSEWNYAYDLNQINSNLMKSSTEDREKARKLIAECLELTQSFIKSDSNDQAKNILIENNTVFKTTPVPLAQYLILNEVLSYLPVHVLVKFRLVNTFWNTMAFTWIQRKISQLQKISGQEFPQFYKDFLNAKVLLLPVLEIELETTELKYCSAFFGQHGSSIKGLKLGRKMRRRPSDESLQDSLIKLKEILRRVPKLEKLCLNLGFITEIVPQEFIFKDEEVVLDQVKFLELSLYSQLSEEFWNDLVVMFPNLKKLHVTDSIGLNTNYQKLHEAIVKHNWSIEEIRGSIAVWRSFTENISQEYAKLKALQISVWWGSAVNELLRFISDSLEVLELRFNGSSNTELNQQWKIDLPIMTSLKTLELRSSANFVFNYCGIVPIQSDQLPVLQNLYVSCDVILSPSLVLTESVFTSVKEINLLSGKQTRKCLEELIWIEKRFPNLTKLTNLELCLNPTAEEMTGISRTLSNVEDLEITCVDQGVYNGLPKSMNKFNLIFNGAHFESSKNVSSELTDGAPDVCPESLHTSIDNAGHSLRDLLALKRLVLTFKCERRKGSAPIHIDETTVNLTFLKLSPKLLMTFRGFYFVSDDLAAKLTVHFKNVYFLRN